MDIRIAAVAILIVVIVGGYFYFSAPKHSGSVVSSTTIQPTTTQNGTSNSMNQSSNKTVLNASMNFSKSKTGWVRSIPYPITIGNSNCNFVGNATFCIGGTTNTNQTSSSYFSVVNSMGLEGWRATIPLQIIPAGCLPYYNEIFCITGLQTLLGHAVINATYYTYANDSGLVPWTQTLSYPINVSTKGCAISGFVIYCVGGIAGNGSLVPLAYYATITKNGI